MSLEQLQPTQRFSNRVEDYVRYRPSYPTTLLEALAARLGGLRGKPIADVGSGTGILSHLLLEAGARVWAVEPNDKMRTAAEWLSSNPGFVSVSGMAEATTLPDASMDLITCAQAFHWFDPEKTRREFNRILKPGGKVALIWNMHREETDVGAGYEKLKVEYCGELYQQTSAAGVRAERSIGGFFSGPMEKTEFPNFQELDFDGLVGRFFSASYAPSRESERFPIVVRALEGFFDRHQIGGKIKLEYSTELFFGD